MTYEYTCGKCEHTFDVIKSYRDIDNTEWCPRCDSPAVRNFVPSRLHISGAKVEHAEFNPGLGQVVRNKHHKAEILKRKGLVEVGNDYKTPDKMQDTFNAAREEKMKKRYEDI